MGAGLLAKAVYQSPDEWLTHRHAGKPAPTFARARLGFGLLAKAVYQSPDEWLTHRHRGQARSHICSCPA